MLQGIGMMRTCAWNDGRPIELVTRMADNSQAISLFCHRPCYDHHHNGDGDDEEDLDDVDHDDHEKAVPGCHQDFLFGQDPQVPCSPIRLLTG